MILIVDLNHKKRSLGFCEFVKPIIDIVRDVHPERVRHYSEVKQQELDECRKVILTGTALKDDQFLEDKEAFKWLEDFEKPVLGICAGMQVLSLMHHSTLTEHQEIGIQEIIPTKPNLLVYERISVYELHNQAVNPSPLFETLAVNTANNSVQAIKHLEKPHYGVLFHPEVRHREIILRFLRNA